MASALLDMGADIHDGQPLCHAAKQGNPGLVQLLLDRGADATAQDGRALLEAAGGGHTATAQLLLDRGAVSTHRMVRL